MPAHPAYGGAVRLLSLALVPLGVLVYTSQVALPAAEEIERLLDRAHAAEARLRRVVQLRQTNARFQYYLSKLRRMNRRNRSLSSRIEALAKAEGFGDKINMSPPKTRKLDEIFDIEETKVIFQRVTMEEIVRILKAIEAPSSGMRIKRMDLRRIGKENGFLRLEIRALTIE